MRGRLRYTPTHAIQQEPMKSAQGRELNRTVSDGVVLSSRTVTRTISVTCAARQSFVLRHLPMMENRSSLKGRSLEAKKRAKAIPSQSPVLSHPQCSERIKSTRAAKSKHIVSTNKKLRVSRRCRSFIIARKGTSLPRNQPQRSDFHVALKRSIAQFWCSPKALPSDCRAGVPLQVRASHRSERGGV